VDLVRHVPERFSLTGVTAGERTLVLMRHAKSDYPNGVPDHDRPLASRGIREGALAGDWLRANIPAIDLVLCSSATRTRQTLERTGISAAVTYSERLYGATPGTMIDEINQVPDDVVTLMVVGHEPTMSQVSLWLADPDRSDPEAADRIAIKYPTSAIAVLTVPGSWAALELGGAALTSFHVPR
jgi:phosphohistidine phosphatase